MRTSQHGIDLIKMLEGFRDDIYPDTNGFPTIGYGHKLTKDEQDSGTYDNGISEDEAADLLIHDVETAETAVGIYVSVPLNQNQFDALVSWTFNLGSGRLSTSTLLRRLNAGEYDAVPSEMARWCKATNKETGEKYDVDAIKTRRQSEAELWSAPIQ